MRIETFAFQQRAELTRFFNRTFYLGGGGARSNAQKTPEKNRMFEEKIKTKKFKQNK